VKNTLKLDEKSKLSNLEIGTFQSSVYLKNSKRLRKSADILLKALNTIYSTITIDKHINNFISKRGLKGITNP
jgi:hypothetical protein